MADAMSTDSTGSVVIQCITLCLIWVVCTAGNVLVCVVIYRSRRLQSTTNYFVVSLACSDLLLAGLCMPFLLGEAIAGVWLFGQGVCKMMRFFQFVLPTSSGCVLLSICIDRFYTILYPLSFKVSRDVSLKMIAAAWIWAFILGCPSLYFFHLEDTDHMILCTHFPGDFWVASLYIVCYVTLTFILPFTGLSFGYIHIFRYIWHLGSNPRNIQRTTNSVPNSKVMIVRMLLWVNAGVIVLSCPYFLAMLCQSSSTIILNRSANVATLWLLCSTAAVKPVLYLCLNHNFRRGCKEVFCMSAMKCYRSNAYTITTASKFAKKNHVGFRDSSLNSRNNQRRKSPSRAFDRATMVEKVAWPLTNGSSVSHL